MKPEDPGIHRAHAPAGAPFPFPGAAGKPPAAALPEIQPACGRRQSGSFMKILFTAPRFHTNQAPVVRGLAVLNAMLREESVPWDDGIPV